MSLADITRIKRSASLLVTRHEDFVGMSVLRGAPPKVVWLNVGNARNAAITTVSGHYIT
jgi:predicted nuclease of predicted toxin-antitoxin system